MHQAEWKKTLTRSELLGEVEKGTNLHVNVNVKVHHCKQSIAPTQNSRHRKHKHQPPDMDLSPLPHTHTHFLITIASFASSTCISLPTLSGDVMQRETTCCLLLLSSIAAFTSNPVLWSLPCACVLLCYFVAILWTCCNLCTFMCSKLKVSIHLKPTDCIRLSLCASECGIPFVGLTCGFLSPKYFSDTGNNSCASAEDIDVILKLLPMRYTAHDPPSVRSEIERAGETRNKVTGWQVVRSTRTKTNQNKMGLCNGFNAILEVD